MSRDLISATNPAKTFNVRTKKNCLSANNFFRLLETKRSTSVLDKQKNLRDMSLTCHHQFLLSSMPKENLKRTKNEFDPELIYTDAMPQNAMPPKICPENNPVAQSKIAADINEEINRLIKKLNLSFTAKKNEARLQIDEGIFLGADFLLVMKDQNLSLKIRHAPPAARAILSEKSDLLKERLQKHEINLQELWFLP